MTNRRPFTPGDPSTYRRTVLPPQTRAQAISRDRSLTGTMAALSMPRSANKPLRDSLNPSQFGFQGLWTGKR